MQNDVISTQEDRTGERWCKHKGHWVSLDGFKWGEKNPTICLACAHERRHAKKQEGDGEKQHTNVYLAAYHESILDVLAGRGHAQQRGGQSLRSVVHPAAEASAGFHLVPCWTAEEAGRCLVMRCRTSLA